MNDTEATSQETGSRLTWLWALGALACVAGLLTWLAMTTERSEVQVVETSDEEEAAGIALTVPVDSFVATVDRYADTGTRVRLSRIPVASELGSRLFWTQLPGERPGFTATYLVALDSALARDSVAVRQGQTVTITGRVTSISDSVVNRWVANGIISEDQRVEVSFATTFLRADEVTFPNVGS